jgi:DNA-binding CsgD family transcriptional regulator
MFSSRRDILIENVIALPITSVNEEEAVAYLANKDREVAIKKYLARCPDASLAEIGKFLGISRQRVHVLLRRMDLKTKGFDRWKRLTPHQLDILSHVAKGYTDRQIAEVIGCSGQAIRGQLQVIYAKLDVHNRKDAVQSATERGLLPR